MMGSLCSFYLCVFVWKQNKLVWFKKICSSLFLKLKKWMISKYKFPNLLLSVCQWNLIKKIYSVLMILVYKDKDRKKVKKILRNAMQKNIRVSMLISWPSDVCFDDVEEYWICMFLPSFFFPLLVLPSIYLCIVWYILIFLINR